MSIDLEYSQRADALYVRFADRPVAYSEDISRGSFYERGIDYDDDDTPVGVELLNVSQGVDLTGVPHADEIARRLGDLKIRQTTPSPPRRAAMSPTEARMLREAQENGRDTARTD